MKAFLFSTALIAGANLAMAAEVTLRNDLRMRLANLTTVYGSRDTSTEVSDSFLSIPALGGWRLDHQIIQISGEIVDGDAEHVFELIETDLNGAPFFVVFNSSGGNFREGVRIGEVLQLYSAGNGVPRIGGVLVLAGDECLSACAVAFTLAIPPTANWISPRYVEQGARLGFHMPSPPEHLQETPVSIETGLELTYQTMLEYLELSADGLVPTALVQNALHYRGREAYFLLEGGLVTRFMGFVPVSGPAGGAPITLEGLTLRDAYAMCQILAFTRARDWTEGNYEFWSVELSRYFSDATPLDSLFQQIGGNRIETDGCTLERRDHNRLGIWGDGECQGSTTGWCVVPRDQYSSRTMVTATGALLADTLGCHGGRMTHEYFAWDWSNRFLEEEEPENYQWFGRLEPNWPRQMLDWSGAQVNTEITMVDAPGGDIVGIWPVGTQIIVSDCRLAADSQGVHYEVTNEDITVWISARFVDVPAILDLHAVPYLRTLIRPVGFQ